MADLLEEARSRSAAMRPAEATLDVRAGDLQLTGALALPANARALVLLPRVSDLEPTAASNREVATALNLEGLATLRLELLTPNEVRRDAEGEDLRFDAALLSYRLIAATDAVMGEPRTSGLRIGYFAAGTTAAAAFVAAAERPDVGAIVSRGGRVDLALDVLPRVHAPALLIAGANEPGRLQQNQTALSRMSRGELVVIAGAGNRFEKPEATAEVASHTARFFRRHLSVIQPPGEVAASTQ
jgi:hypothetical protein